MDRVLLVEESTTLRYLMNKALRDAELQPIQCHNYSAALEFLDKIAGEPDQKSHIAGIMVGWTHSDQKGADALFQRIREFEGLPVIALANDTDNVHLAWARQRQHTALVSWSDYDKAVETLTAFMNDSTGPTTDPATRPPLANPALHVLMVESATGNRTRYRELLKTAGHRVDTLSGFDEALVLAEAEPIDLVICDYFMPGNSGSDLCARLRDNPATTHIHTAILTASHLDYVIEDCLSAGALDCLFTNEPDALFQARIAAIHRLIDSLRTAEAQRRRLEIILGSVGEGVYGVDTRGVITFVNAAAKRILGLRDAASMNGKFAHAVFHSIDEGDLKIPLSQCNLHEAYTTGCELTTEDRFFRHHSGKTIPVDCTVLPLFVSGQREGSVVTFRDISIRKEMEQRLRNESLQDPLTGANNRRFFEIELEAEFARQRDSGKQGALLYIDLDDFKTFNDTAGLGAGNRALTTIARSIKDRLRKSDSLARLGDDEFGVILPNVDARTAMQLAEGLRLMVSQSPQRVGNRQHQINASIGVGVMDVSTASPEKAFTNAITACCVAKRMGKNRTHLYSADQYSHGDGSRLAAGWSNRLREALQNNRFELHFQPIIPLAELDLHNLPVEDGAIASAEPGGLYHYEALVRMRDDSGALINPREFVPSAERFNLMHEVDYWVLAAAVSRLAQAEEHHADTTLSINLSAYTFSQAKIVEYVVALLERHEVDPRRLVFELSETSAVDNLDSARKFITELSRLGCRFALDKFGTGFATFSHLKSLPVDYIKIDRHLISNITRDARDRAIVTSINDIAHLFGVHTVAGYVESPETLRLLRVCGVDYVQGYYISRPANQLNGFVQAPEGASDGGVPPELRV